MVVEDIEYGGMDSTPQRQGILGREVKPDMEAKNQLDKKMVKQYRNMAKTVSREVQVSAKVASMRCLRRQGLTSQGDPSWLLLALRSNA